MPRPERECWGAWTNEHERGIIVGFIMFMFTLWLTISSVYLKKVRKTSISLSLKLLTHSHVAAEKFFGIKTICSFSSRIWEWFDKLESISLDLERHGAWHKPCERCGVYGEIFEYFTHKLTRKRKIYWSHEQTRKYLNFHRLHAGSLSWKKLWEMSLLYSNNSRSLSCCCCCYFWVELPSSADDLVAAFHQKRIKEDCRQLTMNRI